MRRFQTSQYLRRLTGTADEVLSKSMDAADWPTEAGDVFVYHSLFGKGRALSPDLFQVIADLRAPRTADEIRTRVPEEVFLELQRLCYLIPEGFDERTLVDQALDDRSQRLESGEFFASLQLVLTNSCNFSCSYCFAFKFDDHVAARVTAGENISTRMLPMAASGKSARTMSLETAVAVIESAIAARQRTGGRTLSISLFGGEPTLNKSVITGVLERFGTSSGGVTIEWDITTNGSRIDDTLCEYFSRYGVKVIVSVDFLNLEEGTYRVTGATAPWSVIAGNLRRLKRAGVDLYVSSVLSAETWPHWNWTLIDWLADNGIGRLNVIVAFQGTLFEGVRPEEVAERIFAAFQYGQRRGVLLTGYWYSTYLMIVNDQRYAAQADFKTCPATGRMISIEPNGTAFTCKATSAPIGNGANFADLFRSDSYRKYAMRAYRNSDECRGCALEGTCSGGSMGSLEESFGDIERMDHRYCAYMRRLTDRMLRFHADQIERGVAQ